MPAEFDAEGLQRRFEILNERFRKLETQMARVSDHLGIPYERESDGVPPEVIELARAGNTLDAIRAYRAHTNASLSEARDVVLGL